MHLADGQRAPRVLAEALALPFVEALRRRGREVLRGVVLGVDGALGLRVEG